MNMTRLETLCKGVLDDGEYDRSDVDELAEEAKKLIAKHKRLQAQFKKTKAQLDSLLRAAKPRVPGFLKNRDTSNEDSED